MSVFFPYRSTIRALIKNFSIASFFPAFITLLFFQHNRTAYDIVAGTIVVKRPRLRWYSRTPLFHCSNILEPLCWIAESDSRTVPITTLSLLSSRGAISLGDRCWTDLRIFKQSQNAQNLQKSLAVSKEEYFSYERNTNSVSKDRFIFMNNWTIVIIGATKAITVFLREIYRELYAFVLVDL